MTTTCSRDFWSDHPGMRGGLPILCTLDAGHDGYHAKVVDGEERIRWWPRDGIIIASDLQPPDEYERVTP